MAVTVFSPNLLLIIGLIHGIRLQPVVVENACGADEASAIKQQQLDSLNEQIKNASALNEQKIKDAKLSLQSLRDPPLWTEIDQILDSLVPSDCTTQLRLEIDSQKADVDLLRAKCVAKSTKSLNSMAIKNLSGLNKTVTKAESVLKKCATKNSMKGCEALRSCGDDAVKKVTTKLQKSGIDKVVSAQNACVEKIRNATTGARTYVEAQAAVCGFLPAETTVSDEATEAQSNESSELPNSSDSTEPSTLSSPNEHVTSTCLIDESNQPNQSTSPTESSEKTTQTDEPSSSSQPGSNDTSTSAPQSNEPTGSTTTLKPETPTSTPSKPDEPEETSTETTDEIVIQTEAATEAVPTVTIENNVDQEPESDSIVVDSNPLNEENDEKSDNQ